MTATSVTYKQFTKLLTCPRAVSFGLKRQNWGNPDPYTHY